MKKNSQITDIDNYINDQANLDTLSFITCGSVDDGKSTLIGRMLFEAQLIFDDQISLLEADSKKSGTQGEDIDFALLVDGLAAEREQGITIDVAYRFFATDNRKFIVADTPGHEQYTRNMVTGASNAELAIILIDARQGMLEQTCRHSIICSSLGIKHVVIAVNKMDLANYEEKIFHNIVSTYKDFAKKLDFESITPIPISALKGHNIVKKSNEMNWYSGPSLMGYLETVETQSKLVSSPLRFPIQWVNRPNLDFRGFSGRVESGRMTVGESIKLLPSGQSAKIKEIILFDQSMLSAHAEQSVTITLDKEVDLSRGDIVTSQSSPCEISDQFDATLIWMDVNPGHAGRSYYFKLGTLTTNALIMEIKHKYNINTLETLAASKLELNDLSNITFKVDKQIPFEKYNECPSMGSFILIDRITNQTVAAGMINFSLRRANNIHFQELNINRDSREKLNGHKAKVLWFTGISGSGKSTIADALEQKLHLQGIRTYILDGDNVRHGLNKDLGFSDSDRIENIRRVAETAKLLLDAGIVVLTAFISPFRLERKVAKSIFKSGDFLEIFVDTPLNIAEQRDPKGLYKKARRGEIPNFTGIDSPYEPPVSPDFILSTVDKSPEDLAEELFKNILFN